MSSIRPKNTQPEIVFRKLLHARGFRYKLNDKTLPGKPDIVLPKYKTVIFIHGCFWHRHENCNDAHLPKTNIEFWEKKLNANAERDQKVITQLISLGYTVIIVWECELKKRNLDNVIERVVGMLLNIRKI